MKSYIAVAAIMASVASASPLAGEWEPIYTTPEAPVYTTTTTEAPVYTTSTASYVVPVYETTPAASYEVPVYTTKSVSTVPAYPTKDSSYEIPEYSTSKVVVYTTVPVEGSYTTSCAKPTKPATTGSWEEWEAVSSIPHETPKKPATPTTTWAVWSSPSPKPNNGTSPYPKYTGAASQQGIAFGAMALAGVAMLL